MNSAAFVKWFFGIMATLIGVGIVGLVSISLETKNTVTGLEADLKALSIRFDDMQDDRLAKIETLGTDVQKALHVHLYEWLAWKGTIQAKAPEYADELRVRTQAAIGTSPEGLPQ